MDLGSTISRLRAARQMSQGDLAEALGVSRQSVSKWETNASVPDLDKLVKLSRLFGVTLDQLVTGEQSAALPESEPVPAAAAPPSPPLRSRQRLAAIILLCMAFLMWLLLTALGGFLEGLILALPFLVCAGICFAARRRAGLWCAWTVYLTVELYIRWATGNTWTLTLSTLYFTPEMNYMRLAIAWVQLFVMLAMFLLTIRSFRTVHISLKNRRNLMRLAGGWAVLVLLHLLKNWGYAWIYQNPAWNVSLGIRLVLRAGDLVLLVLFAALLTATVCAFRRPKSRPTS